MPIDIVLPRLNSYH